MANNHKALLIGATICIIATVALFLILVPFPLWLVTLCLPALIIMVLSEALLFGGLILIRTFTDRFSHPFSKIGCTSILAICVLAAFIISAVFLGAPLPAAPGFAALLIIDAVVLLLGFGLFYLLGNKLARQDQIQRDRMASGDQRVMNLRDAANCCDNSSTKQELFDLAEMLRFTDNAITTPHDSEIDCEIASIKQKLARETPEDDTQFAAKINHLRSLVDMRNNFVRSARRGDF